MSGSFFRTLQGRVLLVLSAVALLPSLLLGGLGLSAVRGLGAVATAQASLAVEQELQRRLLSRVQEQARTHDTLFRGVLSQAVSLGHYLQWYYDNPVHVPEPGYLGGGSDLTETAEGHRVNRPETPVGVFVSRKAAMTAAVWHEVGLLSFGDPLLTAIRESTPGADRAWVVSASRIVRIAPNVGLGHPGSRVGPDYDLTEDEPFQTAAPERNPHRLSGWTVPYVDPVSGELMLTAVAPIYGGDDLFRAVAGVDVRLERVLESVLGAAVEPGGYAMLLDPGASVIGAPVEAFRDLGLAEPAGRAPGRPVVTPLAEATAPGVQELARGLQGATEAGLLPFATARGTRLAAFAPLPSNGWILCLVLPEARLTEAGTAVRQGIGRLQNAYLIGGALAAAAVLAAVGWLAGRAAGVLTKPVARLVEGTRLLSQDLSHRLPPMEPPELGSLAGALNEMADSLQRSRDEAVRSARLVVEERNRLAREIHDTIAQGLAGIVVHLETAEAILPAGADPDALHHLRRARQLARESLGEARRSVWNLRPGAVEERGLAAGLRQLGAGLRQDGIACSVLVEEPPRLPPAAEDALFRVCQEALANVRRHSGARHCLIALTGQGGEAVLRVTDDGRGFNPDRREGPRPTGGFGLWAMGERMEAIGGSLEVESRQGEGTVVTARVPAGAGEVEHGAGGESAGGG